MVERYLAGRRNGAGETRAAAGVPEDEGLAGHADADQGPEGPPQHAGPGIGAS
jgi:hypothetical protein